MIFKTMILSLLEYGCIIYRGTNTNNISKMNRLFYRGLRICTNTNNHEPKGNLRSLCSIASLDSRYQCQLLLFMHKLTDKGHLLKQTGVRTRLHDAPVFNTYKPNNEKAKLNVLYHGALT